MKLVLSIFLLLLACTANAPAIPILNFARMKMDDQAGYVADLVEGIAKMLKDEGHPDQAQKILDIFNDSGKNGGFNQFITKLKEADSENRKNAINPNNRHPVLQVEDAMERLLKDNGILIPAKTLLTINKNFMPAVPNIKAIQDANR